MEIKSKEATTKRMESRGASSSRTPAKYQIEHQQNRDANNRRYISNNRDASNSIHADNTNWASNRRTFGNRRDASKPEIMSATSPAPALAGTPAA